MKKLQIKLVALLLGAIATFAFTNVEAKRDTETYVFTGSTQGDQSDPSKYEMSSVVPGNCGGNGLYCQVEAEPDPNNDNLPIVSTIEPLSLRQ